MLDKITKEGSQLHNAAPQAAAGAQAETRTSSSEESLRNWKPLISVSKEEENKAVKEENRRT